MLFILDTDKKSIAKTPKGTLASIGWKEKNLQELLYTNLDKIFPEDELLLIKQSSNWQEEPDLMAIDKEGNLNIFELKAWESEDINLLQALRYGQIFGQQNYELLNGMFRKSTGFSKDLLEVLNEKFSTSLNIEDINKKQNFIIITNGTDYKTRQSIKYWASQGLNIQSWIYRIHKLDNQVLIEFEKFKVLDNPFEDLDSSYYILNTNIKSGQEDDNDMIKHGKAAAYMEPWKYKIKSLQKGDRVFLYRSGEGIVAKGEASGEVKMKNYRDDPQYENQEYYQTLKRFQLLKTPIPAAEVRKIGKVNYVFMQTMFAIDKETGEKLWKKSEE